jgi:hypothetical protein
MKNKIQAEWLLIMIFLFCASCRKNLTTYFPDPENNSITAFSNRNYNIASAYINGNAWRTIDRTISGGFAGSIKIFEVEISRQKTNTASDSIYITWPGFYQPGTGRIPEVTISVVIPVAKNFSYRDFRSFHKQRLTLDATNGHFTISGTNLSSGMKLPGSIYFHEFIVDSTAVNNYSGRLNGLFEASFPGVQITKGRFDHGIESQIIQLN